MALSTKDLDTKIYYTTDERKKFISNLREFHQSYFDSIDEPHARFIVKMLFGWPPDRAKFYESELTNNSSLFVEWVSRDYVPEHDRDLYKYNYTANYLTEFTKEINEKGVVMYIVPLSNFTLIKPGINAKEEKKKEIASDFEMINPDEDCSLSEMTIRDLSAILLKRPVSRKEWLNKLILSACQK